MILTEAAGHYNQFKRKKDAKIDDQQLLYMENMYAIRLIPTGLYTTKQGENMPNLILNALVDTLNIKAKVPHTLVIMINDHRFWNNTDLLTFQMERLIKKFVREIRRIVEDRNLSLPPRAVNWDYPRIFFTKPLPLPNNMIKPYPKGFKANRRKYNKILQREEIDNNYKSINLPEFTCENENKLFTLDGLITPKGYRVLWTTISDAIHKADNQHRINMNKVTAKHLSAQISLTKQEIRDGINIDEEGISYLDSPPAPAPPHHKAATKRALINEFDSASAKPEKKRPPPPSPPESTISEYFTAHGFIPNRLFQCHNQGYHHKPGFAGGCYHHKPQRKHRNGKKNWRNINFLQ